MKRECEELTELRKVDRINQSITTHYSIDRTSFRAMPKSYLDQALVLRALGSGNEAFRRALEQVSLSAHLYCQKGPYLLNPDPATVRNVLEGLARNKAKYGRAYCPCRPLGDVRTLNAQNICPCRSHPTDIARYGTCECGLFVNEAYTKRKRRSHESTKA